MSSTLPLTESKKQAREPKRQYEKRVRESTFHVGPISTRLFSKLQTILGDCDQSDRYACLYNMLVMMKEADK